MRRAIPQIKVTPKLLAYYSRVGVFLKLHPEIKSRKLKLGFEVNIGTIPDNLVEEWIEVVKQD